MSFATKRLIVAAFTATCLAAALPAAAQSPTSPPGPVDARVTIVAHSANVGVGYTWGDGTLYYNHHRYPFSVKGVNVAAVGYSRIIGHGRVYNLHRLAQFSGTYGGANGEATVGQGLGGQFLQNGNGVQIRIDDVTRGAQLSGAADGIQLTLK